MHLSQDIQKSLQSALEALGLSHEGEIGVEPAANSQFGDFTSNIAMQLFSTVEKTRWNSPRTLAEAITSELTKLPVFNSQFSTPTVAGPGFINFTVKTTVFTTEVSRIGSADFMLSSDKLTKTTIVEYSSPNIAKPFTVGHLRSTIIGDAIANLLEATGSNVIRDNHLGDWGTQFGKLIVAITELGAGSEEKNIALISAADRPVKQLVKLYVEFHEKAQEDPSLEEKGREWFTRLEDGDEDAKRLWQLCIDWSWTEFSTIYNELGIVFTENNGRGYGESFFEGKMAPIVKELEASGHLKSGEEGAKLFFFPDDEYPPLMILKKDGSTLYATRDLATDKFRLEKYGKNIRIINEVGAEQALYFRQLYRMEELLGWYASGQRVHIKHGLFRFKDGKMSTRKGNVIWLEDVIFEAKKRALALAKDENAKTAEIVAIGSLKWNDLKRSSHLDITFDWDEILSMDGNSGPYIQYTAVRCASVLAKAQAKQDGRWTIDDGELNPLERAVAQQLLYFEDTIKRAASVYAPQLVATYLYSLAGAYNSFYTANRILVGGAEEMKRLSLTKATFEVLQKGLHILGIQVPEEM